LVAPALLGSAIDQTRKQIVTSFRKILVPHDFSPHGDAALDLAIELGGLSKAHICVVHVFSIPMEMISPYEIPMPPMLVEEVRAAASVRLENALSRVRARGLKADAELESGGSIADIITERARALRVDLIVMGTRGLSGLKHLLLGSVAERVLRTAPCPVLTVHAAADASSSPGK
jgi:nucleotide-binding universal stress UspA family protein